MGGANASRSLISTQILQKTFPPNEHCHARRGLWRLLELLWELFRLLGALPGLSGGTLGGQQASEDTPGLPGLPLREGPENRCKIGTFLGGANVAQVLIIIYPRDRGARGQGTPKGTLKRRCLGTPASGTQPPICSICRIYRICPIRCHGQPSGPYLHTRRGPG